jgi:hypothetical protein
MEHGRASACWLAQQHDPAHRPDKRISGHVIAAAMMTSVATIMPIRMPIRTVR